jgi:hypothetical protein
MEFREEQVRNLNIKENPDNLSSLIVRFFCGKNYDPTSTDEERKLLCVLMENMEKNGLSHKQFNELLLLLNQDTVSEDFFAFFFREKVKTSDELKQGVIDFRGFAMLCYGNFKFAYRRLAQMDKEKLKAGLSPYFKESGDREKAFKNRPSRLLPIRSIPRERTWYLGEVTGNSFRAESDASASMAKREFEKGRSLDKTFLKFTKQLGRMNDEIEETEKIGLANTDIYLTWDYMDVYVATSMRNKWEYEETFDFVNEVFEDKRLKELNIRYFDPTQSKCSNSRDKGLLESLMLKRASCAIYLAQEVDTLGKDSELAATLAQGKPVIAYIPKHDPKAYARKIAEYPPSFFRRRLSILDAEEIFDDVKCREILQKHDANFKQTIASFIKELTRYRENQPLSLWREKDAEFKKKSKNFGRICGILAIAECFNFARRADLLKGRHPLCIQADLKTGVANGVLVVRSSKECAELLRRILTNQLTFTIRHVNSAEGTQQRSGFTILEEEVSGCAFRIVTDYERLTNSFWNLFDRGQSFL